jgi:hypothetical protein
MRARTKELHSEARISMLTLLFEKANAQINVSRAAPLVI